MGQFATQCDIFVGKETSKNILFISKKCQTISKKAYDGYILTKKT